MTSTRTILVIVVLLIFAGAVSLILGIRFTRAKPVANMFNQQESDEFAQQTLQGYLDYLLDAEAPIGGLNLSRVIGGADADQINLGKPYPVMYIRLDELQDFYPDDAEAELDSLLRSAQKLWYPVQVDSKTVTKMEIVSIDDELTGGEFGGTSSVEAVIAAGATLEETLGGTVTETVLVEVPALQATFLLSRGSSENDGKALMTPAMVFPERFGLEAGRTYQVGEILPTLVKIAQDIDPDIIR